jgi:hypothetical protein
MGSTVDTAGYSSCNTLETYSDASYKTVYTFFVALLLLWCKRWRFRRFADVQGFYKFRVLESLPTEVELGSIF